MHRAVRDAHDGVDAAHDGHERGDEVIKLLSLLRHVNLHGARVEVKLGARQFALASHRVAVLRVLVHVESRGRAPGFDGGEHRLEIVLVRHVLLLRHVLVPRELIVPVARLLPGVEPLQKAAAAGGELLAEVEVVHDVRHVHGLGVERVRVGRGGHPQVARHLLHEDEPRHGAARAVHLLHRAAAVRIGGHAHLHRVGLVLGIGRLPLGEKIVRELGDGLDGAIAVIADMVVEAPAGVLATLGVDANGRVALHVLRATQGLVDRAVHLRHHHAVGEGLGVLLVHLECGGFPHGVEAAAPRAPGRVEVDEEHGVVALRLLEGFGIQLEDGIGVLRVFGVVALALGVVIDQRLGLVRGELVGVLHGLLGVATFPLDGAERIERGIDRTLEDRLGQVVPVETHGVADVHGGELARQRGERDVEVDAKEVAVLRAVHDNLGVELGGHVRADLAHEQHRDDDAREHGDDASGNRALGHVLRDLPVEVHALEPRLTHQARHLARSAEERADASRGVRAGGPHATKKRMRTTRGPATRRMSIDLLAMRDAGPRLAKAPTEWTEKSTR